MRIYRLQRSQLLPATVRQAWDFFSDPQNLSRITPPWLGFTITSATPPMAAGLILTYTITPFWGLRRDWVSEITHVQPPHSFVDEQRSGPYRYWHHHHRFQPVDGGVNVEDVVHYALPFGMLGRIAHRCIVRPRLELIFDYRREALKAIFRTSSPREGIRRAATCADGAVSARTPAPSRASFAVRKAASVRTRTG